MHYALVLNMNTICFTSCLSTKTKNKNIAIFKDKPAYSFLKSDQALLH